MISSDFFYALPQAVYLLLVVVVILALYTYLGQYRKKTLESFAERGVLKRITYSRSRLAFIRNVLFICLAWILATLALMDPKGNGRYPEEMGKDRPQEAREPLLKRKPHEVIIMVDVSASMNVADMRTGENRLAYAKEISDELIRRMNGETVSIYSFTSESEKVVPSTMDSIFARLVLKNLSIREGGETGTNLYQALKSVMEDYPVHPDEKLKTLVILSDGEDIDYEDLQGQEKERLRQAFLDLVGDHEKANLQIFTIGLGTQEGGLVPDVTYQGQEVRSSLHDTLLKELSKKGGGSYTQGNQYTPLAIARSIAEQMKPDKPFLHKREVETRAYLDTKREELVYDRYYQVPLGIAALFLALMLLLPESWHREER